MLQQSFIRLIPLNAAFNKYRKYIHRSFNTLFYLNALFARGRFNILKIIFFSTSKCIIVTVVYI